MGVEGGDLIDFGLRQPHLFGQRPEMGGAQVPVGVLNEMQMLDQQISPKRSVAQQCPDLLPGRILDLAALGGRPAFSPSAARTVSLSTECHPRHLPNRSGRTLDGAFPKLHAKTDI